MSFCTIDDIGRDAELRHVQTAAGIIADSTFSTAFFTPNTQWQLTDPKTVEIAGITRLWTLYPVSGEVSVSLYSGSLLEDEETINVNTPTRVLELPYGFFNSGLDVVIKGSVGWSTRIPGDSVESTVWIGGVSAVDAEGNIKLLNKNEAFDPTGYDYIQPPPELRTAGIIIGRRLFKLERDQSSQYDQGEGFNGLTDNLEDIFKKFRL